MKDLDYTYHTGTEVFDNVSFEVPSGSIVGLIGENGSGKTTIIKLILNMIKKNGGEVTVLGKNKGISDIKNEIGVVMDEPGFPGFLNAKEINRIMKNIFSNWSDDTFFGYLKKLKVPDNKEYKDMSKGTKMKTGIAVALSHNPRLLILDEATNGLDPVVRSEVNEIFTEFTRDESHSILISSHIVSDLDRICDYIVFIHNGKLMLFEEKDRLLEKYCIVHCTREQLSSIERSKIIGRKENKYDISVLMEKSQVKSGFSTSPVDIEELFVFMAKEDN